MSEIEQVLFVLSRIADAAEKIEDHLSKLSSVVITVEDRHGTDFKAVVTTKVD